MSLLPGSLHKPGFKSKGGVTAQNGSGSTLKANPLYQKNIRGLGHSYLSNSFVIPPAPPPPPLFGAWDLSYDQDGEDVYDDSQYENEDEDEDDGTKISFLLCFFSFLLKSVCW